MESIGRGLRFLALGPGGFRLRASGLRAYRFKLGSIQRFDERYESQRAETNLVEA